MTIIRFPTAAKLGEKPMAVVVPWPTRLHRWLFGHARRKPTWNSVLFDHARRGR